MYLLTLCVCVCVGGGWRGKMTNKCKNMFDKANNVQYKTDNCVTEPVIESMKLQKQSSRCQNNT